MKVAELLEHKGDFVATISSTKLVKDAIDALARHNVGALVVSDDKGAIAGIISERDIVRSLHRLGVNILDEPVEIIMSRQIRTCSKDDETDALMAVMTQFHIRHLPVTEGAKLIGIVSIGDVVKTRIEELEQDRHALESYIHAR